MTRLFRLALIFGFLSPAVWCACRGPVQIVSAGLEDNFAGPPKPVTPSARLSATGSAKGYVKLYANTRFRRFDEDGGNRLFLTSLVLPARKICSAQFEMHVRRRFDGRFGFDYNDYLLLGFAPFGFSGVRKSLFRATMWAGDPFELLEKTVRLQLPAVELNRFVLLTEAPHYFDIMVHNDTTVDYVKLILRLE
jgi:hypothetical protein